KRFLHEAMFLGPRGGGDHAPAFLPADATLTALANAESLAHSIFNDEAAVFADNPSEWPDAERDEFRRELSAVASSMSKDSSAIYTWLWINPTFEDQTTQGAIVIDQSAGEIRFLTSFSGT